MDQREPEWPGTVVVGVDGSADSLAALRFALEEAARRRGRVEVVRAFQPPEYWGLAYGVSAMPGADEVGEGLEDTTQRMVDGVVADSYATLSGVPVEVMAVPGTPAKVLVDQARGADLLVVGHRGHGGIARALLGSVGLQCVLHATCPVTVVRPAPQRETVRDQAVTAPAPA